jgi:hypothetical protein
VNIRKDSGDSVEEAIQNAADKVSLKRRPIEITIKGWYPIAVIIIVLMLLTGGNIAYTIHLDNKRRDTEARARAAVVAAERKADQRWCKLLIPLDDSYQANPNVQASELGRRVAAAIHEIRLETGC